ncbi:synaptotagmin-like 5 [Plakobranchus ocellatus]|uniref:Synaptotagmin-like 5 n=1 Tax=Plakobranchus ocellatus TaxID=259542 RepID=A0AAV4BGP5_9GAST|nr:synaptotagmin-like 5 [Plakobranchus ocellatus]
MGMGKKKKKHKKKDKHEGDKGENEGGEQPDAGGEPKEEGQDKGSDHGAEDKEAKPAEGEGAPEEAAPEAAPAEGGKEESKPEGKAAETASDAGSVEKAEGAGDKASDSAAAAPEKKSKKKKRKSFSKELRDGSRYSGKVPPLHNYTLDFTCLTEEEEKMLRTVVEKDEAEMRPTMEFVRLLNHEMDLLRYRGMGVEGQKPKCLRCRKKYGWWRKLIPIIDQGKRCMICQFKACPGCRYKQANGKYLCGICVRRR